MQHSLDSILRWRPFCRAGAGPVSWRASLLACLISSFHALAQLGIGGEADNAARTSIERLSPERLQAVHDARSRFARERLNLPNLGVYEDFRAVMHVHAEDSDHTKGTRPEVLAAARKAGVRVVIWTDHRGPKPDTWRGLREGVLFIAGSEDGNGVLRFPDYSPEGQPLAEGGLRFLSHIEERYDAASEGFVGMEICNRHTDAVLDNTMYLFLAGALNDPEKWRKLVENFKAYPDEFFGAGTGYQPKIFAKWDKELQQRPFTGIGANDAHQNQIFKGITFDPYEVSFRNLCTHILAQELTETAVRESLKEGRVYVSHDWLSDPTGFAFGAANNLGVFSLGDTAPMLGTTRLVGVVPIFARLKLLHNGAKVHEVEGTNLTFQAKAPGAYRLEAWLRVDGEDRPWIYSNPVFLRTPSLADVRLPSNEISPEVEAHKDIAYRQGAAEDEAKHRLDLYRPKGKPAAPVFFFIHGGAWKTGDRSQYPAIGNRFAKEGLVTVVPSYRLAPQHPHPAQIEDVAAAFAWVARHIAEYGGDTNRIYVGGHSAGGHLASLLSLDAKYLQTHGLAPRLIRGTLALSGVYNLATGESQASVFGKDPEVRRDASPLFHVKEGAAPFLITYCQWDYATLPAQAREFHAALKRANVSSELVFIPRQSHISEMVNVPNEDDPTAAAVRRFILGRP
ncbi:MAG: alpha/beta fold hydrolase [Verrucomicrobia bacterium]|nr:alpha/beta fold hydrolase [Verrucomicrobiota bacterium]